MKSELEKDFRYKTISIVLRLADSQEHLKIRAALHKQSKLFAVHCQYDKDGKRSYCEWRVTHIPTGCKVIGFPKRADALIAAIRLSEYANYWHFTNRELDEAQRRALTPMGDYALGKLNKEECEIAIVNAVVSLMKGVLPDGTESETEAS